MTTTNQTPKPAKNAKTTIAGSILAVGTFLTALGGYLEGNVSMTTLMTAGMAMLGGLGFAYFSRDKDVTSEGMKIPKK